MSVNIKLQFNILISQYQRQNMFLITDLKHQLAALYKMVVTYHVSHNLNKNMLPN
jgi:hypothetical protein